MKKVVLVQTSTISMHRSSLTLSPTPKFNNRKFSLLHHQSLHKSLHSRHLNRWRNQSQTLRKESIKVSNLNRAKIVVRVVKRVASLQNKRNNHPSNLLLIQAEAQRLIDSSKLCLEQLALTPTKNCQRPNFLLRKTGKKRTSRRLSIK